MKILAIDTSTKNLSLAFMRDGEIISYQNILLNKMMSTSLMPKVLSFLKKVNIQLKDVDGFVVGLGPGGFTGLRVGVATVKALAFAQNKPVVGVSSLDALAYVIKDQDVRVVVDARRELVYTAFYQWKKGHLIRQGDYVLTSMKDALKGIKKDAVLTGDAIAVYEDIVSKKTITTDKKQWFPQARFLALLAYESFKRKKTSNVVSLAPLYLYSDDCQVRPKGKKN